MLKLIFVFLLGILTIRAQGPRLTTSQYDNFRSGANLQEHTPNAKKCECRPIWEGILTARRWGCVCAASIPSFCRYPWERRS